MAIGKFLHKVKGEEKVMREQWVWEKKYNLNDGWSEGGVMEKGTETCLRQPMKRKALESQKRV